jgi:hypothetical protein
MRSYLALFLILMAVVPGNTVERVVVDAVVTQTRLPRAQEPQVTLAVAPTAAIQLWLRRPQSGHALARALLVGTVAVGLIAGRSSLAPPSRRPPLSRRPPP